MEEGTLLLGNDKKMLFSISVTLLLAFKLQVWSIHWTFRDWIVPINFLLANTDLIKISDFILFDKKYLLKHHYAMIKDISSNKMQLQLRFALKNKDLKRKIIQLKLILHKLFRILLMQYQPTQLYLMAGFSLPNQASFFLIYAGYSAGMGYPLCIMPRPPIIIQQYMNK